MSTMNISSVDNLKLLFWLRNIAIVSQIITILIAIHYFRMHLPLSHIAIVIASLVAFNLYTGLRSKNNKKVTDLELFFQLSVDLMVLTGLLAITGGASNPFAVIYLLPLTIGAIILPSRLTWLLVFVTVLLYSSIVFFYIPMPHAHSETDEFGLHVFGMWFGFILSALIIAYFVAKLRKINQRQHEYLDRAREQALRDEQLVELGIVSASAAHELGTPLNNIALILDDIKHEEAMQHPSLLAKIETANAQILRCRNALTALSYSSGDLLLRGGNRVAVGTYLRGLVYRWKRSYPGLEIEFNDTNVSEQSAIIADRVLDQALVNILDNAVRASPDRITVTVDTNTAHCFLNIRDYGPGIEQNLKTSLGKEKIFPKSGGLGLGLFLTHAIIERIGGSVKFYNDQQQGLLTLIELPLSI